MAFLWKYKSEWKTDEQTYDVPEDDPELQKEIEEGIKLEMLSRSSPYVSGVSGI